MEGYQGILWLVLVQQSIKHIYKGVSSHYRGSPSPIKKLYTRIHVYRWILVYSFFFFMGDRLPLWLLTISVDCLCIILYDMLYINVEPWSSQDITKWQIMYVCILHSLTDQCQDSPVQGVKEFLLGMLIPEDAGITILWNSTKHRENDTATYPKVLESSASNSFAYWNKINR